MSARQREYLRSLSDAEMLSVTDLETFFMKVGEVLSRVGKQIHQKTT